jgi:hypothetical protein
MDKYDKQEIPCLASVGNAINADMYGDLKYYGNKIFCWICCMIICGPFFMIMGLSSLADAAGKDERLARIPVYNKAVDDWNSAGAAAFGDISFTLKIEDAPTSSYPTSVGSAVSIEGVTATGGKCSGNAVTATSFAEASTPTGTFQFACGTGFHLKADSATITAFGATDALKKRQCCDATVAGKCAGNSKTATGLVPQGSRRLAAHLAGTFKFKCDAGKHLKANPTSIVGATDAACCDADVAGMCSGNTATATDLAEVALAGSQTLDSGVGDTADAIAGTFQYACGSGYLVKSSAVALSSAVGGASATPAQKKDQCCEALYGRCSGNKATAADLATPASPATSPQTFGYACGAGFKYVRLGVKRPGGGASADKAACCIADITGMCSGNTATATDLAQASTPAGTFQFACPTNYKLKTTSATIAGKTAALCCDGNAGMCSGNTVTATNLDQASTPAGTFQFACGPGLQLKATSPTIAASGADDNARKVDCCDAKAAASEASFDAFEPTYVEPDASKREKETFTKVTTTKAYKIALKRNNKVVSTDETTQPLAMTKMTLAGAGVSNTYTFQSVIMKTVPEQNLEYNWYVAKSSTKGPSSITCKAPSSVYNDYPGTRFNGGTLCDKWCSNKGGKWTGANSKCYSDKTSTPTATGCCIVPEKKLRWGLKKVSFAADCSSKTACTVDSTKPSLGGAMNALTAFKASPYTSDNLDQTKMGDRVGKASYPSLIYAEMPNGKKC